MQTALTVLQTQGWEDYELLDSGDGKRLERFGAAILVRPDPQCIWQQSEPPALWATADAVYEKRGEGGSWNIRHPLPREWKMSFKDVTWWARLSPFKHTGVFPEQVVQWEWMQKKLEAHHGQSTVLNLFGYTGIATLAAAACGAAVTHVDASKPTITWARQNQELSGLADKPIRWILDDAMKFVSREVKRGKKYDGIILDPPAYGHGPTGKPWKFHDQIVPLLQDCRRVLSDDPQFVLMNAYAISSSALMLGNIFVDVFGDLPGNITAGELALKQQGSSRLLSTGIFARWEK